MHITLIEKGTKKKVELQNVINSLRKELQSLDFVNSEYKNNNSIIITFSDDLIFNYALTQIIYEKGYIHLPFSLDSLSKLENYLEEIKPIFVIQHLPNEKKLIINHQNDFCLLKVGKVRPYLCASTSGSTGKSKIIVFSKTKKLLRAKLMVERFNLSSKDTVFCSSPYSHSLGQRLIHVAIKANSNIVYINKFNEQDFIEAFQRNKVSFSIPVTTHLEICGHKLERNKFHKTIISSSGSLSEKTKKEFINKFKNISYEMYGLSEFGTCTITSLKEQSSKSYMGKCLSSCQIKIIYEKDKFNIDKYQVGKIALMNDWAFSGYIIERKFMHISNFLKNGLFITDDCGFLDENNNLYFISRDIDILKVSGYKVSCKDIQDRISKYDPSLNIFITSIEHEIIGQAICCAIFSAKNENICEKVREFSIKNMESYMRPVVYKHFNKMPLLENGKKDLISIKSDFTKLIKSQ